MLVEQLQSIAGILGSEDTQGLGSGLGSGRRTWGMVVREGSDSGYKGRMEIRGERHFFVI